MAKDLLRNVVGISLVVLLLVSLIVLGGKSIIAEATGDFEYEFFEIDGMPCVRAKHRPSFGFSCDWEEWTDGR